MRSQQCQSPLFPLSLLLALSLPGCVPADEALPLGSAQFTITARGAPQVLGPDVVVDGWTIKAERFLVSFKTMTIVNLRSSDQCSYRGRGEVSNLLFDGVTGSAIQSFNGMKPGSCPDVGMRLGVPDDNTVLGEGVSTADLVSFVTGAPALAMLAATASIPADPTRGRLTQTKHVLLRFDATRTATAFGGCRDAIRGARIQPEARDAIFVTFGIDTFFRDAVSDSAQLRFAPFAAADADDDGLVTMDELDAYPLSAARAFGDLYVLPSGSASGSFGDWVRAQFEFTVRFGKGGVCDGIDPGTVLDP